MIARLYANEKYALKIVMELRKLGHDVLTSAEAGRANRGVPDEDVFDFAISQRRAVVTNNRYHFFRLAHLRPDHHGLIACTFDNDTSRQARAIHQALMNESTLQGKIIRIYRHSK